jgi:hypothetical protein
MSREVHVRFWEGLGVRLPRATRLVRGDARGYVYLKGRPVYNAVSGELRVEGIEYDLDTRDLLLRVAAWLASSVVEERVQEAAVWNLQPDVESVREDVTKAMNRELARGVSLSGELSSVEPVGVWVGREEVLLRVDLRGDARIAVDPAAIAQ